ncbi:MAG: SDR family oxidoreductase [Hydrogenophilaceae bacterium]|jgi:NAD(P)-dependent dehydrogenase (short-subunit alcohol dehydrogenase family)|nr:SDR family oxidoreductase [Hydrogenophilaceae bacterium]
MPIALVTGANSGIGRALAFAFARRGYDVVAAMRDPAKAAEALAGAPGRVRPVALDVTQPASIAAALADVRAHEGEIDVLVNNAGVSSNAPLEMLAEDHHRLTFETNYWGPVRLMQAVLPSMRERKAGLIINISSMMRRFALPGTTPYAASKAALEMASEVVALEAAAFGVRVVVIEPGVVVSRLQANTAEAGRWLPPDATPYAPVFAKTRAIQKALLAKPLDADEAAEIMLAAALAPDPPFRLLVGADATEIVPAREKMRDEEWIALAAAPAEEHKRTIREKLGLDVA